MFPLTVILGIACYSEDDRGALYALPLALGGAVLAGYHTLLVAGQIPKAWIPCGAGVSCSDQKLEILNGIQNPWLALVAFFHHQRPSHCVPQKVPEMSSRKLLRSGAREQW